MGHHEINAGKRLLRIGCEAERNLRIALRHQNGTGFADNALTLGVIVIQPDLAQGEAVHIFQQHHNNPRSIGTATAGNSDDKFIFHFPPLYS